jgi:hypothetical protein
MPKVVTTLNPGSSLPGAGPKPVRVEDLKDLSDKELVALANGHHERFVGTLRKAIVEHARVAGAALFQLKSRHKSAGWRAWVGEHFKGSAETANTYIRVYRNWPLIVEQGLDKEGVTLEKLRWVLSESLGREEADGGNKGKKASKEKDSEDSDAEGEGGAPPGKDRQIKLFFAADEAEEFEEQVRRLTVAFKFDNNTDTIREAVHRCWEEVTRG